MANPNPVSHRHLRLYASQLSSRLQDAYERVTNWTFRNKFMTGKFTVNRLTTTIWFGFTLQSHLKDAPRNYTNRGLDHIVSKKDTVYQLPDTISRHQRPIVHFNRLKCCSQNICSDTIERSNVPCTANRLPPRTVLQEAPDYELFLNHHGIHSDLVLQIDSYPLSFTKIRDGFFL